MHRQSLTIFRVPCALFDDALNSGFAE